MNRIRSRWVGRVGWVAILAGLWTAPGRGLVAIETTLPVGPHPEALGAPHFPNRMHAFIWRNWSLVDVARIAEVLQTQPEQVTAVAESMGLPPQGKIPASFGERALITIVRRNWHLLPYDQLLELLGIDADELAFRLREDDFLFIKLGSLKPRCAPLLYVEPDDRARQRASEIRQLVQRVFGSELHQAGEPRFAFVEQLSRPRHARPRSVSNDPGDPAPRYIYSYFGTYGDPLIDQRLDPYPDGLLERLAERGVNGVWLHVLLRQLAPGGPEFPEFGVGHEQRLQNLRELVRRAQQYGIGVYLYVNEPRAMPAGFFRDRPDLAGVTEGELRSLCTSQPIVRQWLSHSLRYVFQQVPGLAGVFAISASENLTSCWSHFQPNGCPRCRERSEADGIAELVSTLEQGVHAADPTAHVIAWDWGWNRHGESPETIRRLPDSVWLLSVSEWAQPIVRGGVRTQIGEYALSAVGPGPRARQQWATARQRGLRTAAKVQLNATWELASLPYLPVMDLVAEHCANLARASVDGMMLSWTVGGYPSLNLQVADQFARDSEATAEQVLDQIAREHYGSAAAPLVRQAWTRLSDAFRQYPYHGTVVYRGPQQMGPANLLYAQPTGFSSTMVGLPYDDLANWRGPYGADVFADQFQRVADGWHEGCQLLQQAVARTPAPLREPADRDLHVVRAAGLHFASVANQARFIMARDTLSQTDGSVRQRRRIGLEIQQLLADESQLARELFLLARDDSRIGFEASNHYFYVPLDLVEKVINCEFLQRDLKLP